MMQHDSDTPQAATMLIHLGKTIAAGRTFLSLISPGSMPNGRQAAATVPSCGGGFRKQPAFAVVFASSLNGPHGAAAPKALDLRGCASRRRLGS
jgi:hypothetical protein